MFEDILSQSNVLTTYFSGTTTLFVAAFTSIISVANPLAAMPVFLSLTEKNNDVERTSVAKKSSFYMFLVLIIFLLAGTYIMSFFGISLPGIRIAGGLIILRAAYAMLNPDVSEKKISDEAQEAAKDKEDISFSPMAMPMLSGPGSIAVVIGLASQAEGFIDLIIMSAAIILVALISYGVLRLAPFSAKYIGPTGMNAITRMMGFIAMAIGVQFILNGISKFFGV
ncbi:MarC family NAAT transporter [Fodinibius sp. Rm-B-1B1-1]|uniref:MarC family NAAT transporter n=1 Tax=Fodinibius alkaliphilus TaxID=3140241 RepID=UPI00315A8710